MEKVTQLAQELNLKKSDILKVYNTYWKAVKQQLISLPFSKNLTEQEFNKLQTSVSVPYFGKIYCDYKNYKRIKTHRNEKA